MFSPSRETVETSESEGCCGMDRLVNADIGLRYPCDTVRTVVTKSEVYLLKQLHGVIEICVMNQMLRLSG